MEDQEGKGTWEQGKEDEGKQDLGRASTEIRPDRRNRTQERGT